MDKKQCVLVIVAVMVINLLLMIVVMKNRELQAPPEPQKQTKPVVQAKYTPMVIYPHERGYDYTKVETQTRPVEVASVAVPNYTEWSADWERLREAR